jgi:hypothetical protein
MTRSASTNPRKRPAPVLSSTASRLAASAYPDSLGGGTMPKREGATPSSAYLPLIPVSTASLMPPGAACQDAHGLAAPARPA